MQEQCLCDKKSFFQVVAFRYCLALISRENLGSEALSVYPLPLGRIGTCFENGMKAETKGTLSNTRGGTMALDLRIDSSCTHRANCFSESHTTSVQCQMSSHHDSWRLLTTAISGKKT